jgi:hypothetical protein
MSAQPSQGVRLWDLKANSCRWALGGPWDRVEVFCGEPTAVGCPWCAEHRERVYDRAPLRALKKPRSAQYSKEKPTGRESGGLFMPAECCLGSADTNTIVCNRGSNAL